jgi:hypothetical protein
MFVSRCGDGPLLVLMQGGRIMHGLTCWYNCCTCMTSQVALLCTVSCLQLFVAGVVCQIQTSNVLAAGECVGLL